MGGTEIRESGRDRPWAALSTVEGINSFVSIRWPSLRKRTLHLASSDPNCSEVWTFKLFYGCLMHPIPARTRCQHCRANHWKISTNVKRFVASVICAVAVGVAAFNLNGINALCTLMNGQRLRNSWRFVTHIFHEFWFVELLELHRKQITDCRLHLHL